LVTLYLRALQLALRHMRYWRHGRADMSLNASGGWRQAWSVWDRSCAALGGEPLLNPEWNPSQNCSRERAETWLLTSAYPWRNTPGAPAPYSKPSPCHWTAPIGKPIRQFAVSMRWTMSARESAAAAHGVAPSLRSRATRQLPATAEICRHAKELGARQVSFLAWTSRILTPSAHGRLQERPALLPEDLPVFDQLLHAMELEHEQEFNPVHCGEPKKLRRIWEYFAAIHGQGAYPPCAAIAPSFPRRWRHRPRARVLFISGPADVAAGSNGIETIHGIEQPSYAALRPIRNGARAECKTCVCSMWRMRITSRARYSDDCRR